MHVLVISLSLPFGLFLKVAMVTTCWFVIISPNKVHAVCITQLLPNWSLISSAEHKKQPLAPNNFLEKLMFLRLLRSGEGLIVITTHPHFGSNLACFAQMPFIFQVWQVFMGSIYFPQEKMLHPSVILFPHSPASLTHKNPQRRKIICVMCAAGREDWSEDVFLEYPVCVISVPVLFFWLLLNDAYFFLVFVVLYNRRGILLFQWTVIQSFRVCVQINCVVNYKRPWDSLVLDLDRGRSSFFPQSHARKAKS